MGEDVRVSEPDDVEGFSRAEFDDLVQRCAAIQDMAAQRGWALLIDAVNEIRTELQHTLAFGGAKDWEQYLKDSAKLQGMEIVLTMPQRIQNRVNTLRAQRREDSGA